jgi:hypothetical protein
VYSEKKRSSLVNSELSEITGGKLRPPDYPAEFHLAEIALLIHVHVQRSNLLISLAERETKISKDQSLEVVVTRSIGGSFPPTIW